MRDWNWTVSAVLFQAFGVLILPMRDWNNSRKGNALSDNSVLILPMRDWNFQPPWRLWSWYPGFDLTYEGLKRSTIAFPWTNKAWFWSYLWGIETLYCIIDNWLREMFWSYLWGIEILIITDGYFTFFMFWSYLWGIEITPTMFGMFLFRKFWSYLWGIEIPSKEVLSHLFANVLILPMRDWNRFLLQFFDIDWLRFDLTYEGLK